jgi:FKBP-type peptidyl-prolyl cis-trans isomerase FkpA
MKYCMLFIVLSTVFLGASGQNKISKGVYKIPDSLNATAFYAKIKINTDAQKKRSSAGINADGMSLVLGQVKGQNLFSFGYFAKPRHYIVYGKDTDTTGHYITWNYNWQPNETYPLLIVTASDSAAHKTLYSGYVYLPTEKKWKLICTDGHNDTATIKYLSTINRRNSAVIFSNRWLQRSNGTWKALDSQTTKPPVLRPMPNIDSLSQQKTEEDILRSKLPKDSITYEDGMFYQTLKEGTGRLVKVTDTLTVHYRGSLFSDGSVFDETKDCNFSFTKADTGLANRPGTLQSWRKDEAFHPIGQCLWHTYPLCRNSAKQYFDF